MKNNKKKAEVITGLGDELSVLLGQEKSRIWLFNRIPDGVTIPLPNGLLRELNQVKKKMDLLIMIINILKCIG